MEHGDKKRDISIANSLVAKVQLGLPSTVAKLGSKMRFIDQIAPKLRNSGVIRTVTKKIPLTLNVTGIATASKTIPAFGGILYSAGALRQDLSIQDGVVYQTYQDSLVDIDEADDVDVTQKLKFVHINQMYDLLEELLNEANRPELVIVDSPLILERSDAPLESYEELHFDYIACKERIEQFWKDHKHEIYPFNSSGVKIVSVSSKRFGSVFYGLTSEHTEKYMIDSLVTQELSSLSTSFDKIKKVGVKKLLNGVLTRRTRTAAYEFDLLTSDNRLEPQFVRELGVINFHFRAGMRTMPLLVEAIGHKEDWKTESVDELTSDLISLYTIDQLKALPLPLWYASHGLKAIKTGTIIQYYKSQAHEMIKNENVESVWTEEVDLFGEDDL
ncbi:hypothetical protein ACUXCC_004911 [Cytobacillus horneckiae]|uniref:hypothetical protein n=1 Tax=Cytobacillus horneckiae TaxID=549687 RepID=UPI0019D1CDBC|nr:hypothetical protein [Cytobacillus horneckiae]MBN6889606.1 hypothetical protein [Cytobacillus horneckiae]MCM3180922.1 hypothetical protein [Cytobacillus horneckiae]